MGKALNKLDRIKRTVQAYDTDPNLYLRDAAKVFVHKPDWGLWRRMPRADGLPDCFEAPRTFALPLRAALSRFEPL
jgi:hypothetical protein